MRAVAAHRSQRPSYADFEIVDDSAPDADPEAVAAELRARPEVEYAQPRYRRTTRCRGPTIRCTTSSGTFRRIDMERAWDIQPRAGIEITVAVLDTRRRVPERAIVRYNARALALRLDEHGGPLYPPLGLVNVPFAVAPGAGRSEVRRRRATSSGTINLPFDLDGHGTHVSGTIGQLTNNGVGVAGMAYNVRIMPVKVHRTTSGISSSAIPTSAHRRRRGARHPLRRRQRRQGHQHEHRAATAAAPRPAVEEAIRYAVSRGAFVAVAAGNNAEEGNGANRFGDAAPAISQAWSP